MMYDDGRKRKAARAAPANMFNKKQKANSTTAVPTVTNTPTQPTTADVRPSAKTSPTTPTHVTRQYSRSQRNASPGPSSQATSNQHITRSKTHSLKPSSKIRMQNSDTPPPPGKMGLAKWSAQQNELKRKSRQSMASVSQKNNPRSKEIIEISDSEDERPRKRLRPNPMPLPKRKATLEPEVIEILTSDDEAPAVLVPRPKPTPKSNPKIKPSPLPPSSSAFKPTPTTTPTPIATSSSKSKGRPRPRPLHPPTSTPTPVRRIDLRTVASSSSRSRTRTDPPAALVSPKVPTTPKTPIHVPKKSVLTPVRVSTHQKGVFADENEDDVDSLPVVYMKRTYGKKSGIPANTHVAGSSGDGAKQEEAIESASTSAAAAKESLAITPTLPSPSQYAESSSASLEHQDEQAIVPTPTLPVTEEAWQMSEAFMQEEEELQRAIHASLDEVSVVETSATEGTEVSTTTISHAPTPPPMIDQDVIPAQPPKPASPAIPAQASPLPPIERSAGASHSPLDLVSAYNPGMPSTEELGPGREGENETATNTTNPPKPASSPAPAYPLLPIEHNASNRPSPSELISAYNSGIPSPVPSAPSPPAKELDLEREAVDEQTATGVSDPYAWDLEEKKEQEELDEAIYQSVLEASATGTLDHSVSDQSLDLEQDMRSIEEECTAIQVEEPNLESGLVSAHDIDTDEIVKVEDSTQNAFDTPYCVSPFASPFVVDEREGDIQAISNPGLPTLSPSEHSPAAPTSPPKKEEDEPSLTLGQNVTDEWEQAWRKEEEDLREAILRSMQDTSVDPVEARTLDEGGEEALSNVPLLLPDAGAHSDVSEKWAAQIQGEVGGEVEEDRGNGVEEGDSGEEVEENSLRAPSVSLSPPYWEIGESEQERLDLEEALRQSQVLATSQNASLDIEEQERQDVEEALFQSQLIAMQGDFIVDVPVPLEAGYEGQLSAQEEEDVESENPDVEVEGRSDADKIPDHDDGAEEGEKEDVFHATAGAYEEDTFVIEDFPSAEAPVTETILEDTPTFETPMIVLEDEDSDNILTHLSQPLSPQNPTPAPRPSSWSSVSPMYQTFVSFSSISMPSLSPVVETQPVYIPGQLTQRLFAQSCLPPRPRQCLEVALDAVEVNLGASMGRLEEEERGIDGFVLDIEPGVIVVDEEGVGEGQDVGAETGVVSVAGKVADTEVDCEEIEEMAGVEAEMGKIEEGQFTKEDEQMIMDQVIEDGQFTKEEADQVPPAIGGESLMDHMFVTLDIAMDSTIVDTELEHQAPPASLEEAVAHTPSSVSNDATPRLSSPPVPVPASVSVGAATLQTSPAEVQQSEKLIQLCTPAHTPPRLDSHRRAISNTSSESSLATSTSSESPAPVTPRGISNAQLYIRSTSPCDELDLYNYSKLMTDIPSLPEPDDDEEYLLSLDFCYPDANIVS